MLLDYLRALDNEQQDIPLAAVLSSSFGGLTKTELAVLKSEYKELPFHQAVFRFYEEWKEGEKEKAREDAVIGEKLDRCLSQLERLREIVPYMGENADSHVSHAAELAVIVGCWKY